MPDFSSFPPEILIPADSQGLRLDQALARLLPGLGRRGAKRVLAECRVLVDGRPLTAGSRVSEGQIVRVSARGNGLTGEDDDTPPRETWAPMVHLAVRNADFAALVKPAGVHCEGLCKRLCMGSAGRAGKRCVDWTRQPLEDALPELLPDVAAILLNRLDQSVSGLVLAALHNRAAQDYAMWQDQGRVRKEYLALVHGRLHRPMLIRCALDTARRRKVRALSVEDPDGLRWTRVTPLCMTWAECREVLAALEKVRCLGPKGCQSANGGASWVQDGKVTAVRVDIHKGRRHQIRAHLASLGHPVLLDPLYGPGPDVGWIALHHRQIILPGFRADSGSVFMSIPRVMG